MADSYHQILESLRDAFPRPVSDPVHDAYFVYSISRSLDQVDALKSDKPILGSEVEPNWEMAREATLDDTPSTLEEVIPRLVHCLEGLYIFGHPRCQINVVPPPSIASIIGVLLPSIYNPNLCSEESGRLISEAEVRVASMMARMMGYDPHQASGVFTFGGTGTMLYGARIGIEKAVPDALRRGVDRGIAVLASDCAHYSMRTVAGWLGVGEDNVVLIPTTRDNSIRLDRFEAEARKLLEQGRPLGAIVASMGTTDAFGLDDLKGMVEIRDQLVEDFNLPYRPHIHADAVIGWAWRAFQDYDFEENPLGFRGRTLRALAAANYRMRDLGLADSIGIDFHKTGYTPYVSSMFLVRDQHDFGLIARRRETMPYLYQSGEYHPGMFTLETSRSGTGPLGALANLLLFGRQGMRSLLGHVVEMAEVLREQIQSHHQLTVLNGENVGPVTLFRAYPPGIDTFTVKDREFHDAGYREQLLAHNDYNRRIFQRIHGASLSGRGVALSMTECYRQSDDGQPIAALKSYVMSPFTNEQMMADIVQSVLQASHEVDAQRPSATPDETLEQ